VSTRSAMVRAVVYAIEIYRNTISPLRLPTCRFTPSCSQYAVEAFTEFGLIRGGWLAMVRLLKCGPWHNGGWDPIPDRVTDRRDATVYRGLAAESACREAEHRASTVEQGEIRTRV
jgi:putative membrane protein insertion efficiency factor